jgi:low temperature requirement protein LtrA
LVRVAVAVGGTGVLVAVGVVGMQVSRSIQALVVFAALVAPANPGRRLLIASGSVKLAPGVVSADTTSVAAWLISTPLQIALPT